MKREHSKYHQMYHQANKKSKRRLFLFLIVVMVGIGIFFTFFYEGNLFTGKVIASIDLDNAAKIVTSFEVPELKLNGDYSELVLVIGRGAVFSLDGINVSLDKSSSEVVLKNFKGEFYFDDNNIEKLKGTTSEFILNGNSIKPSNNIKISIETPVDYETIEISNDFYIRTLDYSTSGEVSIDKSILRPNNERIVIRNYMGSLRVLDSKFFLDGYVEYFEIDGDSVKSVFQK